MTWTNITFLETGDSYYDCLLQEIRNAKDTVLMEKYIFRFDSTGRSILEELALAQKRGVRVYLRIDGVGSADDVKPISEFCGKEFLDLEVFHPLPFAGRGAYYPAGFARVDGFLTRWRMINRRTHRKLVIVDERIAFTGGRNVADVHAERMFGDQAWHDLSLRLEGESVKRLVDGFWFRPAKNGPSQEILMNYNWRLRQNRNSFFSSSISKSQKRVWVITPYLAPTPSMLFHLRNAARRGVDIRIVLARKIDVPISRIVAIGLYRKLMRWGIKIFEYEPKLLHRKLWLFDDTALVGSANFNHRSFIHDLELDIVLRQSPTHEKAEALFATDQSNSVQVHWDDLEKLPIGTRVLSWLASWLTYWL